MKKLLLAASLLLASSVALAQPGDQPAAADKVPAEAAPPAVDTAPVADPQTAAKKESVSKDAAGDSANGEHEAEAEGEGDPSEHFNFTNFSWMGKDEWGGAFGDGKETDNKGATHREEEPMAPPFVFMLLNFALLLFILFKYGKPAARKVAEDRHDQIKTALDEAKKLREEAAAKLADFENRIKDVDSEIAKLVAGIRADAEADKKRILEQAERQSVQMKKDAELRIAAEIEMARATLAREVAFAATAATETLLKSKTTPDDQNKLVGQFITGIGGN